MVKSIIFHLKDPEKAEKAIAKHKNGKSCNEIRFDCIKGTYEMSQIIRCYQPGIAIK